MITTVIFDLDGTLLNTIDDLADAANWVCAQNGWPEHSTEQYKRMVGNGIPKLVERFVPPEAHTPDRLAGALAQFSARYAAHKMDKTVPYAGIPELLRSLRGAGVDIAVYSNKADGLCRTIIRSYFGDVFTLVRGSLPDVPNKPDPTGVCAMLRQLEADPACTLFVGDSDVDILTAHNAGLAAAGVSWGFRGEDELRATGAEYVVDTPEQLLQLIRAANTTGLNKE